MTEIPEDVLAAAKAIAYSVEGGPNAAAAMATAIL